MLSSFFINLFNFFIKFEYFHYFILSKTIKQKEHLFLWKKNIYFPCKPNQNSSYILIFLVVYFRVMSFLFLKFCIQLFLKLNASLIFFFSEFGVKLQHQYGEHRVGNEDRFAGWSWSMYDECQSANFVYICFMGVFSA